MTQGCATSRRISCGLKARDHRVGDHSERRPVADPHGAKLANLGIAVFTEERKLASCDRVVEIVVPINTGDLRFVTHAPPFRVNSMHVLGAYYGCSRTERSYRLVISARPQVA